MQTITIDGHEIGQGHPPFVIGEISGNHNGDIWRAFKLMDIAKEAGASAVKFQTYTADDLTIPSTRPEFTLQGGGWKGQNLYDLYTQAQTPYEWFPKLFDHARSLGLTAFSSPFSSKGVRFLDGLGVPAFKVASNELGDWMLLKEIAKTGKPAIFSTGTSKRDDVAAAVAFARSQGQEQLVVLHCISEYPAPARDANIRTLQSIHQDLDVIAGFSDHTLGIAASVAAVALGASVIEKHITLDREDGGVDSKFSLEPDEFKSLCSECLWAWESLGTTKFGGENDLKSKGIFTRQFWTTQAVQKGEVLSEQNLRSIRAPSDAGGIPVRYFERVLGSASGHDLEKHAPLLWDDLEEVSK